jgi:hypothetical protein
MSGSDSERRREERAAVDIPLTFYVKGKSRELEGTAKNISVGGMQVETSAAVAFGAAIDIYMVLPGGSGRSRLPGIVRWVREGQLGVQFQLLGAIETHLITQLQRRRDAR